MPHIMERTSKTFTVPLLHKTLAPENFVGDLLGSRCELCSQTWALSQSCYFLEG